MTSLRTSNPSEPADRRMAWRAAKNRARIFVAAILAAQAMTDRVAADVRDARPAVLSRWEVFTHADGLPHDSIGTITIAENEVWVGTDNGIAVWNENTRQMREVELEPREFPVSAITIDPVSHDAWVGTLGGGLLRLTGGRCDRFDQRNSGLAGDIVFAVAVQRDDVFAATNGGLSVYHPLDDEWDLAFARRRSASAGFVRWVVDDGRGALAVSTRDGVLQPWQFGISGWGGCGVGVTDRAHEPEWGRWHQECAYPRDVAVAGARVCFIMPGPPRVACLDLSADTPRWDVAPLARIDDNPLAGYSTAIAASGPDTWVAGERGVSRLLGPDARLDYDFDANADRIRVQHLVGGNAVGTATIPVGLPAGRIRCLAARASDLWVGTTSGLIHATQPIDWPSATSSLTTTAGGGPASSAGAVPLRSTAATTPSHDAAPAIAIYGPRNRQMAFPHDDSPPATIEARPDARAVAHVVEAGNSSRAHGGLRPVEVTSITPGYDRYGWGLPEDDLVRLAIRPNVAGILGDAGEQGGFTDATIEAMEVVWLDVSATARPALSQASRNRWLFQCMGDLPRQHRLLVEHVARTLGRNRLAVIRASDGDGDRYADWWIDHAKEMGTPVVADVRLPVPADGRAAMLADLKSANPDALLTWADAERAAEVLRAVRGAGSTAIFVGGPQLQSESFMKAAREVGGMILASVPAGWPTDSAAMTAFGMNADGAHVRPTGGPRSALSMSRSLFATEHLLKAVEIAGTDRDMLRSVLEAMERSATGEVHAEEHAPAARATIAVWEGDAWRIEQIGPP